MIQDKIKNEYAISKGYKNWNSLFRIKTQESKEITDLWYFLDCENEVMEIYANYITKIKENE